MDSKALADTHGHIKQHRDHIKELRKANKSLKSTLSTMSRNMNNVNEQAMQDNELRRLDEEIFLLRRKLDDVQSSRMSKSNDHGSLKEQMKSLEKETQPLLSEDSSLTKKIRLLENRLDKAMIKYNEAQSIRKTYEQIVKRLTEERVGFDNQLAAIERTLKAKEHDYQELLNMSHDANHAKEIAKAELAQFRAAYEEERRQKDKELTERKQYVQSRIDQTQKLEKREKMRRTQELEALQRQQEQQQAAESGIPLLKSLAQDSRSPEELAKLQQYEEAFRKIKEVTGVTDVHEVIQKFIAQEETHRNLVDMTKEAQSKIDRLNAEKSEMKAKVEELKYSGSGQLGSRRIVDEFETHLSEAQHHCEQNRMKYDRVARILINTKAGVEHLYDKLMMFKTDGQPIQMADETCIEILKNIENKLINLIEETAAVGTGGLLENEHAAQYELPAHNRRIKLPGSEDQEDEDEDEEEEEEEDVLDRETVKKLASIAVARETKKAKKKKSRGGKPDSA